MIDDFFAEESSKVSKQKKVKKRKKVKVSSGLNLKELDIPTVKTEHLIETKQQIQQTSIKDDFEMELGLETTIVEETLISEDDEAIVITEEIELDDFEKDLLDYQTTVNLSEQTLQQRMGDYKKDISTIILIHLTVAPNEFHVKVKADKSVGKVINKFKTGEVIYFPQLKMYLSSQDTFYALIGCREVLQQDQGMLVCRGFLITKQEADLKLKEQTASSQPEEEEEETKDDDLSVVTTTTTTAATTTSITNKGISMPSNGEFPITLLISEKLKYKVMVKPDTIVDALCGYLEEKIGGFGKRLSLMFDNEPLELGTKISETEIEEDDIIDVVYL